MTRRSANQRGRPDRSARGTASGTRLRATSPELAPEAFDPDEATPVNVLVVDDHPGNRAAIAAVLESPSYRVVTAESGREALRCVLREEFAVVLLDVRMPEMDGFEVASVIRQRRATGALPIIFLTSESRDDIDAVFKGYTAGAVDYLIKPVSPDVVRAKVAVFAALFRQREAIRRDAERRHAVAAREREVELAAVRLASERRYHNLAEAVPQIVFTARADGRTGYVNRRWFEFTGLSAAASRDRGWHAALDPEDREQVLAAWRAAVATSTPLHVSCRLIRHDGASRWQQCDAVPERDAAGRVVGWIGALTDIDDQKRVEAALGQAVRTRDEFLQIAAHELRTPLTTMRLQVEVMQRHRRRADAPSPQRDDPDSPRLETLGRQVERLTRLVEQLLDVSRITAGRLHLATEPLDLAALAREVAARLSEEATRARTQLVVRADAPVPGRWDRLRLDQVLTNLLSNAIKYGAARPVELEVHGDPLDATLVVRDQGIGIALEAQAKIFDRFERAVSERNYGGLGLGLFIVQQIVAAHGGTVRVESTPGAGATFTVVLPRVTPGG